MTQQRRRGRSHVLLLHGLTGVLVCTFIIVDAQPRPECPRVDDFLDSGVSGGCALSDFELFLLIATPLFVLISVVLLVVSVLRWMLHRRRSPGSRVA